MTEYKTFAETEALLLTAIRLPGRSTKDIAAATSIRPSTLYKWKTKRAHLSPAKSDVLLLYFMKNEPGRLEYAEYLNRISLISK